MGGKQNFDNGGSEIPRITDGSSVAFKKTLNLDGMGRGEGGGFRMGNTCIPVVDSL